MRLRPHVHARPAPRACTCTTGQTQVTSQRGSPRLSGSSRLGRTTHCARSRPSPSVRSSPLILSPILSPVHFTRSLAPSLPHLKVSPACPIFPLRPIDGTAGHPACPIFPCRTTKYPMRPLAPLPVTLSHACVRDIPCASATALTISSPTLSPQPFQLAIPFRTEPTSSSFTPLQEGGRNVPHMYTQPSTGPYPEPPPALRAHSPTRPLDRPSRVYDSVGSHSASLPRRPSTRTISSTKHIDTAHPGDPQIPYCMSSHEIP